ncbi:MAG TPA: hypothetical protein VK138_11350 [Acidiferrobacterales bacterium]|nr:hypothetical protein [Acidiferrobacterales bacterium]
MELKRDLFTHLKKLNEGLAEIGGEAFFNVKTFLVEIRLENRVHKLYPQFLAMMNGKRVYTLHYAPDVLLFSGWRSYFVMAEDVPPIGKKLKFKELMIANNLRTPEFSMVEKAGFQDVIVKRSVSAFGMDVRGPYKSTRSRPLNSQNDEFYEKFIEGQIVKVWYWDATPVCLEIKDKPLVIGDGKSTIGELAKKKIFNAKVPPNWTTVSELLAYYAKGLDTVLKPGEKQVIDISYTSEFLHPLDTSEVNLPVEDPAFAPLNEVGRVIAKNLPAKLAGNAVYSVDAILDNERKLWFLEVNFNPFMHPNIYPFMVRNLPSMKNFEEIRFAAPVH